MREGKRFICGHADFSGSKFQKSSPKEELTGCNSCGIVSGVSTLESICDLEAHVFVVM